jgi:selenocysteine lyase/cysteine desulfurase
MTLSAMAFRDQFPSLNQSVYLASCSLGARSIDLDEAMNRMLDDMVKGGSPWDLFEKQVFQARETFAALVGARVDQVAVVPNATIGAYQVASTTNWTARPKILTTTLEFPSIAHVWLAQQSRGADVVYADGPEQYAQLVDQRTRLVSVPMTDYQDAQRLPVAEIVRMAHSAGAEVFVDAYQAVGVEPVDVNQLGCDYLVAGTMKYLLGLPGLAFLYVRRPELTDREPQLTGWFGRSNPFAFDPQTLDFAAAATRFETGTPAVPAIYAANAGLQLIAGLDLPAVREHVLTLTDLAIEHLAVVGRRVRMVPRGRRGAHIGLIDADPGGLALRLAGQKIVVSPRGGVARLSFHYYSSTDDVTALCAAIAATRDGCRHRTNDEASGRYHVHS